MVSKIRAWSRRKKALVSVLFVAVACGVMVAYLEYCEREYKQLVAQIRGFGGDVQDSRHLQLPSWLNGLASRTGTYPYLERLGKRNAIVSLSYLECGDEQVKTVARLPGLSWFDAYHAPRITDDGLSA